MSKELEALESIMLRAKEGRNKEQQKYIESNYELVKQALIEQEKKDELLDKLYQEELNKPLKKNGKRGYTNSTRLRILKQIKALEEEMK